MRVAAIYDIHGNLPALEAVLEDVREEHVDHVVVGGDVVLGPMVRETLACLLDLDVPVRFIQGNCEVAVLEAMAGQDHRAVPEQYRPIIRWTAQHLQVEYGRLLANWPKTLRIDIEGCGDVLFCHGTPRDDNECFTRLTPEDRLLPIFDGLNASLVVCGHTQMQFDRMIGRTRVVNAGSVGMPFGRGRRGLAVARTRRRSAAHQLRRDRRRRPYASHGLSGCRRLRGAVRYKTAIGGRNA